MLLTAISKRRVKLKAPVILLAPQQFLYLTLVIKLPSNLLFYTTYEGEEKEIENHSSYFLSADKFTGVTGCVFPSSAR
jgi:hypothetical protein